MSLPLGGCGRLLNSERCIAIHTVRVCDRQPVCVMREASTLVERNPPDRWQHELQMRKTVTSPGLLPTKVLTIADQIDIYAPPERCHWWHSVKFRSTAYAPLRR